MVEICLKYHVRNQYRQQNAVLISQLHPACSRVVGVTLPVWLKYTDNLLKVPLFTHFETIRFSSRTAVEQAGTIKYAENNILSDLP